VPIQSGKNPNDFAEFSTVNGFYFAMLGNHSVVFASLGKNVRNA
jgi:hypothetical protein